MDLHDALRSRRTIHRYVGDQALPEDVLHRAIEAAHHAPCHKLTWPWRFRIAGPETRAGLAEVAVALKVAQGLDEAAIGPVIRRKVTGPAALLIVTQQLHDDPFRVREDYAACACAVQNLMLSLHADGWGSKWGTGAVTRHPDALTVLGIQASEEDVIGWIYVGKAASVPEVTRPAHAPLVTALP